MPDPTPSQPIAAAILVAAGRSTRMGGAAPKPLLSVAGRPVLAHAVAAFLAAETVGPLVVVVPEQRRAEFAAALEPFGERVTALVPGGAQRTDSARNGLAAVPVDCPVALVHDAARPLVRPEHIDTVARTALERGAALLAVPVADTLHRSPDGKHAVEVLDRSALWAAQTPQGFRTQVLAELLERAAAEGLSATDEAGLHERYLGPIPLVQGSPTNLKLTTPDDLRIAAALLAPPTP